MMQDDGSYFEPNMMMGFLDDMSVQLSNNPSHLPKQNYHMQHPMQEEPINGDNWGGLHL